jgi:transposase
MMNDDRLDLWSLDECHFQQHGTRCRMWIPREDRDPIVLHAPTRKSVALFGAVNFLTGALVTMFAPQFDALTFEAFLRVLLPHRRRSRNKTVIVLDNARYHHASLLAPFLEQRQSFLRLDFLPPYSPDLNPIERVWKHLRKLATHNRYFSTLEELTRAVRDEIRQFEKPNPTLVSLCCKN